MKIKEIRTRVIEWRGKTVPLPPHFCTNPMDAVSPMLTKSTMGTFTFHSWLICEIFTDNGLVSIGNAALSPRVTKQVIDLYLKPLLIGQDPWDIEFLWQHMYRKTIARAFFGACTLSFGDGVQLADGDVMEIAFAGFGRALKNPLRIACDEAKLVTVKSLA